VSHRSFPALGIDPTPGEPDDVTRSAQSLHDVADQLALTAHRAGALDAGGLRAQVVDRFLVHLGGPVATALTDGSAHARSAAETLATWALRLRGFQAEATDLERRALLAVVEQSPDLGRIRALAGDLNGRYRAAAARCAAGLEVLQLPVLTLELVPGVPLDALLDPDNRDGFLAGGIDSRLPTDPAELLAALQAAREMGLPAKLYAPLLQQYYMALAAEKVGLSLADWNPGNGALANELSIEKIYEYYAKLYAGNPDQFTWAGMANLIGGSFGAGFYDLDTIQRIASAMASAWPPGVPKPPYISQLEAVATMGESEFAFYQSTLLAMQKQIFFDASTMHEAYLSGGMGAMDELLAARIIDQETYDAWAKIATGDPAKVAEGNKGLLSREQNQTIVDEYNDMAGHPVTGQGFTYLMTVVGKPSIPGAQSPGQFSPVVIEVPYPGGIPFVAQGKVEITTPFPNFNIADPDDRWKMVLEDTLPAYEEYRTQHPEAMAAEVARPPGDRMDENRLTAGGVDGGIDELIGSLLTDWSAEPSLVVAGQKVQLP
jgi:hypothetical protein